MSRTIVPAESGDPLPNRRRNSTGVERPRVGLKAVAGVEAAGAGGVGGAPKEGAGVGEQREADLR